MDHHLRNSCLKKISLVFFSIVLHKAQLNDAMTDTPGVNSDFCVTDS